MGRTGIGAVGLLFGATIMLSACGGDDEDRASLIESRLRVGNTQEQSECYADAVIDEFGEDPANDGELSDEDVEKLLGFAFDCVGGAEGDG